MFRKPFEGKQQAHLADTQFEFSQAYLARARRLLFLRGPLFGIAAGSMSRIDSFGPTMITDDIMAMNNEDQKAPIYLVIDSPGGDVSAGMVLYDIIRMSKAPITTIAQNCASMATVLMAAGTTRLMFPHSRVMLHLPSGAMQGDADTVEIRSKELTRVKNSLVDCYIECGVTAALPPSRTGKPPAKAAIRKKILGDINRSEYWLSAQECVAYGLIDRLATPDDIFGAAK